MNDPTQPSANINTTHSKPTGALALLEKYSTLNKGIEDVRSQVTQAQSETEDADQNLISLKDEYTEMLLQSEQAECDIKTFQTQIESLNKLYDSVKRDETESTQKQDSLKRDIQLMDRLIQENRMEFLTQCRDFRTSCKRIKLDISTLPLIPGDDGVIQWSSLSSYGCQCNSLSSSDDESSFRSFHTDDDALSLEGDVSFRSPENKRDDSLLHITIATESGFVSPIPESVSCNDSYNMNDEVTNIEIREARIKKSTNNGRKKKKMDIPTFVDEELIQAQEKLLDSINASKVAKSSYDEYLLKREEAKKRAHDRAENIEQQRSQLSRLRKQVVEMETELKELEQSTVELNVMAEAFEKDASKRNNRMHHSVTPTQISSSRHVPSARNNAFITPSPSQRPQQVGNLHTASFDTTSTYAHGNTTSSSSAKNPYLKKKQDSNRTSKAITPTYKHRKIDHHQKTSIAYQYPHLAGRIRVDKQFSVSLSIGAGDELNSIDSDDEDDKKDLADYTPIPPVEPETHLSEKEQHLKTSGISKVPSSLLDSSSDDDDDDILTFTPFL